MDKNKLLRINALFEMKASHPDDCPDDNKSLIIEGFANTTSKDRAGDIILDSAWLSEKALTNYTKNPIILAFHDHSKPIGKMIGHEVNPLGLRIKAEISPAAGDVHQLIKDGVLQAFSVGFRVLDADFDPVTDIFVIKDLELHEISVVSVPCNQDSIFQVSKSFESDEEFTEFKTLYTKPESKDDVDNSTTKDSNTDEPNEEFSMDPKELQALVAKQVADGIKAAEDARTKAEKEVADKKAAEKEANERVAIIVKSQTETLVADLEAKSKESAEAFASMVAKLQTEITEKGEEISSILASRNNKMNFLDKESIDNVSKSDLDNAFLLGMITNKGMFETEFGKVIIKAVNTSSSGVVSSDKFEQVVTTRLEEDVKELLTVEPMFRSIQLTSATQVLPINPAATTAGWVNPTAFGTADSTGSELTKTLTEIILQTHKLAGKSYITDETEEDAILPILPLLRDQLVQAHANEVDNALINSTGSANDPTGLISRATTAGGVKVNLTTAKADGTVLVTAKMILQTRRGLGQWGLDIRKLGVVVSLDAYWDLLEDDEFSNVNEVTAAVATKLTGQVGSVYGMPVIISTQMPAKATSAVFAIIVNSGNFVVPRLRGFNVQSDYDVEFQRRVIVATQRLGFSDIISGEAVSVATYAAT